MPNAGLPHDECPDDPFEITRPGARTGRGTKSLLPYLTNARDTAPAELLPLEPAEKKWTWGASGVRWVLRKP